MPPSSAKHSAVKSKSKSQPLQQGSLPASFASKCGALHPEEPPSKRAKNSSHIASKSFTILNSGGIGQENMYKFSSTKTNGGKSDGDVIDLTDSPPRTPTKPSVVPRKVSGTVRSTNFQSQLGAKKLVVKNFRTTPKATSDQYFNKIWMQLDLALDSILEENEKPISMEELYRGVENVCRQDRAATLFEKMSDKCQEHIVKNVRRELLRAVNDAKEETVLTAVCNAWVRWERNMATVRSIFYYMDRSYLLHSPEKPSIDELGIELFRSHIFRAQELKVIILEAACSLMERERTEGRSSSSPTLLSQAINMFHTLCVYTKDFEPKLLGKSQSYFENWVRRNLSSTSLAGYVRDCHMLMERELERCDLFKLDVSTKRDLIKLMDDILVAEQEKQLLNKSKVIELMDRSKTDSLKELYTLLQRKNLAEGLRPVFEAYINTQGSAIVFDTSRESEMVVRLLRFKRKLDRMWEKSFMKHEGLGHSLREAFEVFINKSERTDATWGTDNSKPGEMIAKYVDTILKGGIKAVEVAEEPDGDKMKSHENANPEDEEEEDNTNLDIRVVDEEARITQQLDQVLDMFRFVHGKAVFEAFYKKDLARRLLMERSASADAEKSMLTRLTSECGSGFTHNLEQMFKDVELAREEMASYKLMLSDHQKRPSIDFTVNVLSASAWPTYQDVTVEVPRNIQIATSDFEKHYILKHSGRKLVWKHALAHCQLKATFPKGNKMLVVSGFQAIVMLCFNDNQNNDPLSYEDIAAATRLNDDELKRTLQSLACAKWRVLTKSPKGKDVNTSDKFVVNLAFEHKALRVKINTIQLKETKEENKDTHERVAADRHYETQAAIVRIMKSQKTVTHAVLVSEVIRATKSRGVLDPTDIKKNIDKLIEKDYLERDEEHKNTYNYLA